MRIAFGLVAGTGIEVLTLASLQRTQIAADGKDAAWSPDGNWIAFVREPSFNTYQLETIWIMDPNGAKLREIGPGGYPSWSADSQEIYGHERRANSVVAYDINAPGAPPRVILKAAPSMYPAVSPDGKRIAFGAAGRLDVIEAATGRITASWPTPGQRGLLPSWSPDGKYVTFGGFDDSRLGLCAFDVASGKAAVIVEGPCTMPAWSADGEKLAFDLRSNRREVWVATRSWIESRFNDPAAALGRDAATGTPGNPPLAAAAGDTTTLLGAAAPDFTLLTLDQDTVHLTALKGQVVVLDFWATWCPPCRRSLPNLQKISADSSLRDQGLRVFAVNAREPDHTVRDYIEKNRLTLTVPMDRDGEVGRSYRVRGIPTTVVIDREGRIQDVLVGYGLRTDQELDAAIRKALRKD